ncbi:GntR family transcriptional regulator [Sneathiella chinensis]|uniref:Transcriptional regulator n=1 Tax=Sneathiella chinensis TaxID=349750 RepID=A0ABQ5U1Y5_9PROT|nr:GntR family transcriptional regulator [Sneathiella chinensis]GLQ05879.1 transcriptional regulator [Sneathiella chinensis]
MAERKSKPESSRNATVSLSEFVYQEVLQAIREGKYHPGERIRETEITKSLDVSRTPVREAFRRLQSEGRLIFEAQRGAVVAELDPQEVAELYALRQQLEGIAARFAAQHASEAEVQAMEFILEKSYEATNDLRELNQINWELHHAIYHGAHNRFLIKAFGALSDSMALLRGVKYIPEGRAEKLHEEHRRIVEAIRNRDPDAADEAAQDHIRHSFQTHLQTSFQQRAKSQQLKAAL